MSTVGEHEISPRIFKRRGFFSNSELEFILVKPVHRLSGATDLESCSQATRLDNF